MVDFPRRNEKALRQLNTLQYGRAVILDLEKLVSRIKAATDKGCIEFWVPLSGTKHPFTEFHNIICHANCLLSNKLKKQKKKCLYWKHSHVQCFALIADWNIMAFRLSIGILPIVSYLALQWNIRPQLMFKTSLTQEPENNFVYVSIILVI